MRNRELRNCKVSYGNFIADGELKSGYLFDVLHKLYKEQRQKFEVLEKCKGWKLSGDENKLSYFKKQKLNSPWILINSDKGDKCKEIQNPFIIIDIDDLEVSEKDFNILNSFPFVVGSGISCSGCGYYSVVKFSRLITEEYEYKFVFSKLEEYYKERGYIIDQNCKNPNRKRTLSPYPFKFNDNYIEPFLNGITIDELEEQIKVKTVISREVSYNFKPEEGYCSYYGEIKSGVIGNLGGNEARMFVGSCVKKYFPDDYIQIINDTFCSIDKEDLKEIIDGTKYEKSGVCVKSEVRNWCFDNLAVFEPLKKKKNIIWGDEKIDLTEFLNNDTEKLADGLLNIDDNKYLADVINYPELPKKVIINSPCGSGKSYWVKKIFEQEKKVRLYCPYKSIQSVYYKELEQNDMCAVDVFRGDPKVSPDLTPRNIASLRAKDIKRGETVIIDEAHLFMVDSQYRDQEIKEVVMLCERKDVKVVLLTGTPTVEYIKQLKSLGFSYYYYRYKNQSRNKKINLLNLEIQKTKTADDIVKVVKNIIQKQENSYNSVLICSDRFHKKFKSSVNLFEPAKDICSENYNSGIKEVRDFCRGEVLWNGVYLMTRYGFAGIDYKGEGKYLCVVFNSEINLPDLIQLSNRFRKGEVDIINLIDGDFNQTEKKINNIFSIAYSDLLEQTRNKQIKEIGYRDYISIPENQDMKNLNKLKKKALYNYSKLQKEGKDIIYNGEVIKYDGEDISCSWERLNPDNKFSFSDDYRLYYNIIDVRDNEENETFLKYVFEYDKIQKLENQVKIYDNYGDRNKSLSYYYGDIILFGGWELDYFKTSTYDEKIEQIIKGFENNEKYCRIDGVYKNYLSGLDKINYRIKMEQIARIIIKIDESFNFSVSFREKYQGEKIYRDIIKELEKENIVSFNNPDPEKWFNEEIEIITDKGTEKIKIHNSKTSSKVGKNIGKAVGRALNYKFFLNTNPDIKFRSRKEAYDYCQKNLSYKASFRSFDRDDKKFITRIA